MTNSKPVRMLCPECHKDHLTKTPIQDGLGFIQDCINEANDPYMKCILRCDTFSEDYFNCTERMLNMCAYVEYVEKEKKANG